LFISLIFFVYPLFIVVCLNVSAKKNTGLLAYF